MSDFFLITCEHGGNHIPARYQHLFHDQRMLLDSHRGYDPGALTVAMGLARRLAAPLVASTVSRLLIDLNRSVGHPRLYSEATRQALAEVRRQILEQYYRPYRSAAERLVRDAVAGGRRVIHVSCHSFTPDLAGKVRDADIGLLYDPARAGEADWCARWKTCLKACAPEFKVRRNYPYAGKGDGLTAYFRMRLSPIEYIGIELEVNQKHVFRAGLHWEGAREAIIESLAGMIESDPAGTETAPRKGRG